MNFGLSTESAVRVSSHMLAPWEIHDVQFKGVEVRHIQGKKDPTATYDILSIKYGDEDGGYYNLDMFFPKAGDDQVREFPGANGGTIKFPSTVMTITKTIQQTIEVLNPEGLKELAGKNYTDFNALATDFAKIMEPVIGKKTKLKLVGKNRNGRVEPATPRIVSMSKEGQPYISANYIGDKLFWTPWEEGQREAFKNAKPSEAPKEEVMKIEEAPADDLNIDDLL